MALDWDNIVIKTDEYSYSLDSEQRMIIFEGQPGAMGPSGGITIGSVETLPAGSSATVTNTGTFSSAILNFGIPKGDPGDNSAVWGAISGTLSDQTDLDNALASKADTADLGDMASVDDAPSDNKNYVRKNGTWSEITGGGGGGSSAWGDITGTLSDQTDLQSELDMKIEDAPSDGAQYARKDGQWTVVTGGGGGGDAAWGGIVGTLANQTDLQTALDAKPDEDDFAPDLPSSEYISDGLYYDRSKSRYVLYRDGQAAWSMTLKYVLSTIEALKLEDAPRDDKEYVRKNGYWAVASGGGGGGAASWGSITGTLSAQTDLQSALDLKANLTSLAPKLPTSGTIPNGIYYDSRYDLFAIYKNGSVTSRYTLGEVLYYMVRSKAEASEVYTKTQTNNLLADKANTADLGSMATKNDAPSDGSEYVRKNGAWAVSSGGSGGTTAWGGITGTLSDQTDLNTALSGKADASSVYTKTEADNLLSAKANTADLGDLAAEDDAPSDNTQYARKNGQWDQIATPAWGAISGTLANQTDLQNALNAKQNTLTFDNAPTSGSSNPVTSDGINSALASKANTSDLGDMATVDDAPSDNKNYARKNGTWSEVTGGGGGSGLPAGGTIGQILAKRSETDGDAGWYNLRHLPSDKWYLPDGILESDVIAAFQFVNRLDEAEALLNINDSGSYSLSKIIGTEAWYLDKGVFIPGAVNVGLTNAALLSLYDNVFSAAFGYSDLNITGDQMAPGILMDRTRALELSSYVGGKYTKVPTISGLNANSYRAGSQAVNGVLAGNWTTPPQMYRNGESLSLTQNGGVNNFSNKRVIGQLYSGNFASCYITALVFYKVTLTASQHLELSDNIIALGGIE